MFHHNSDAVVNNPENVNSPLSNFSWESIYISGRWHPQFTLLVECNLFHRQEEELNRIVFNSIPYLIIHIGMIQSLPRQLSWMARRRVAYSITAWEINKAYYFDGFFAMCIEGVQRIGKTAYASKAFTQAFGEWERKS